MTDHIWWGLQTIGQESIPEEHSSWAGIDIKETLCWEHSNHLIYNGSLQVLICGCGSEYGGVDADRFLDWNHGGKVGELRREAVSEDIDKDSGCGKLRVGVHVVSGCHRHLSTTQNCLIISLFINNAHQTNSTTVKHCNYFILKVAFIWKLAVNNWSLQCIWCPWLCLRSEVCSLWQNRFGNLHWSNPELSGLQSWSRWLCSKIENITFILHCLFKQSKVL